MLKNPVIDELFTIWTWRPKNKTLESWHMHKLVGMKINAYMRTKSAKIGFVNFPETIIGTHKNSPAPIYTSIEARMPKELKLNIPLAKVQNLYKLGHYIEDQMNGTYDVPIDPDDPHSQTMQLDLDVQHINVHHFDTETIKPHPKPGLRGRWKKETLAEIDGKKRKGTSATVVMRLVNVDGKTLKGDGKRMLSQDDMWEFAQGLCLKEEGDFCFMKPKANPSGYEHACVPPGEE